MKQIKFGTYKSYDDLNLVLKSKSIGSPSIKKYTVDVEGADGVLDYTDYFGEPNYGNQALSFDFSTIVPQDQFLTLFSSIKAALHGQKLQIVLDDDPDFYYVGRLSVSEFTNDKNIGNISIDCDCEPYKYKKNITNVSKTVSGSATIALSNLKKKVVPTITSSATMTFAWDGNSVSHAKGTFQIPTLELGAGTTNVTVTGTGTVKFSYQEGGF